VRLAWVVRDSIGRPLIDPSPCGIGQTQATISIIHITVFVLIVILNT
jgi:hypothetical protein